MVAVGSAKVAIANALYLQQGRLPLLTTDPASSPEDRIDFSRTSTDPHLHRRHRLYERICWDVLVCDRLFCQAGFGTIVGQRVRAKGRTCWARDHRRGH